MKLTIHRYFFHEIWPPFMASLMVFVFIVLATRIINLAEWVVNHGVRLSQMLEMIGYLLPGMILFALPASALMSVFIAFHRLSNDNEILALKASGISLYQMMPPVVAVSSFCFVAALVISLVGAPWGHRSFKDLVFLVAHSKADLGIQERVFSEPFSGVTFYVNGFSEKDRKMQDVFLVDRRDASVSHTIVAKEGRIVSQPESRSIGLLFVDGTIFISAKKTADVRTIVFDTYDMMIGLDDIMPALSGRDLSPKEMSYQALRRSLESRKEKDGRYHEMLREVTERLSIPFAVFLMGIIGVPLGAQLRAGGRFIGIVTCFIVFLLYYLLLAGFRSIGETGVVSPAVGSWIPVVFLLAGCVWLLRRAAKERTINLLQRFFPVQEA
ncbi:MAG: LPS export ABC transporter permease LptF [Desulfatiglandales bacterium]